MRFLLDTDHITILQREAGPEFTTLAVRIARCDPDDLAFSIISFHEQVLGCHTYINRATSPSELTRGYGMLARVIGNFGDAPVLPFNERAASTCSELGKRRIRIGTMDLRIASIALSRGLTLLTRNRRDFERVPGLQFEDWTV